MLDTAALNVREKASVSSKKKCGIKFPGTEYIVFGRPKAFGHSVNISHPEIDPVENAPQVASGLTPLYHTTELMKKAFLHSRAIQDMQYTLLSTLDWQIPETLPESVVTHFQIISVSFK